MRFGVPKFSFGKKKQDDTTETTTPAAARSTEALRPSYSAEKEPPARALSVEADLGKRLTERYDPPSGDQPEWGHPIIEVNEQPQAAEAPQPKPAWNPPLIAPTDQPPVALDTEPRDEPAASAYHLPVGQAEADEEPVRTMPAWNTRTHEPDTEFGLEALAMTPVPDDVEEIASHVAAASYHAEPEPVATDDDLITVVRNEDPVRSNPASAPTLSQLSAQADDDGESPTQSMTDWLAARRSAMTPAPEPASAPPSEPPVSVYHLPVAEAQPVPEPTPAMEHPDAEPLMSGSSPKEIWAPHEADPSEMPFTPPAVDRMQLMAEASDAFEGLGSFEEPEFSSFGAPENEYESALMDEETTAVWDTPVGNEPIVEAPAEEDCTAIEEVAIEPPASEAVSQDSAMFSALGHQIPAGAGVGESAPPAPRVDPSAEPLTDGAPLFTPAVEIDDAPAPTEPTPVASGASDAPAEAAVVAAGAREEEKAAAVAEAKAEAVSEESSKQAIALEEKLRNVTEGLWSYKRYLEQFRGQLGRELDQQLDQVATQLSAFEDKAATLRREFAVGMNPGEKLGLLDTNEPVLSAALRDIEDIRNQQRQTASVVENLGTIIQRYSDLLEDVALFEGQLKRYMKQVDGSAKQRLRQNTRQDFIGSSAIIRSQEMERARIAREIHDGPAQAIANVILRLDLVEKMMAQRPELVGKEFLKMKEIAQGALNEIRGFIFDLRPMTLQDLGLTATLKKVVQANQALSDCHFELIVEGEERPLSPEAELAIFRIAQEALTNVKKHALASSAYVHVKYLAHEVVLIVEDDGHGFEAQKNATGEYTHFGLIGMQERADDIDGDLQVISQRERGTKVIFSLRD